MNILQRKELCMQWIYRFQLFLFDFDGLLVNTEYIHYQAYQKMCSDRGVTLQWDFPTYCSMAHYSSDALQREIYQQYPMLHEQEPHWSILYQEKKEAYLDLLDEGLVSLMPGAFELLTALSESQINRCVVTNSAEELVKKIIEHNPILDTIPHWITREKYQQAKPHPECYVKAIEEFAKPQDRILGIEDTPRGLQALRQTRAEPVLVSELDYPEIQEFKKVGIPCYRTLYELMNNQEEVH